MPTENGNDGSGGDKSGGNTPAGGSAKTPEQQIAELTQTVTKLGGQMQETAEELKRVNALNAVLMQRMQNGGKVGEGGNGMSVKDTVKLSRDFSQLDPANDPEGYAAAVVAEAATKVREVVMQERSQADNAARLRQAFFEANKDLATHEVIVAHFANEVQQQLPHLSWDQGQVEVAKRTREYLKSRGFNPQNDGAGEPPAVLPGNNGGNGGDRILVKGVDDKPYNEAEAQRNAMKEYAEERAKERDRSGSRSS